ncbi:MAG: class I SAM-dependent methyltransferase [Fluviicola sp. XM-24bin1]|nr:MAG: class I SAM-dependent methyltransferase [Fluviicola sp. XM-24bin1]
MENFDHAARNYDEAFTNSCVGVAQREQVWKYVDKHLNKFQNVLEVNCGTGEDAHRWDFRGKGVVATDVSPEMIRIAESKFPELHFRVLDVNNLCSYDNTFDTLFSNFGGLNCLSPAQLKKFFANACDELDKNGHLVVVMMGKKCVWERFYFGFRAKFKKAGRRNTKECVDVHVEGETVKTWYFSPNEIKSMASEKFELVKQKPIGLFIPPSYLASKFEKRKRTFAFLKWLDGIFTHARFSNNADHYLMILKSRG